MSAKLTDSGHATHGQIQNTRNIYPSFEALLGQNKRLATRYYETTKELRGNGSHSLLMNSFDHFLFMPSLFTLAGTLAGRSSSSDARTSR